MNIGCFNEFRVRYMVDVQTVSSELWRISFSGTRTKMKQCIRMTDYELQDRFVSLFLIRDCTLADHLKDDLESVKGLFNVVFAMRNNGKPRTTVFSRVSS